MGHRLLLGGTSSGKSTAAEQPLLELRTLYVATGPQPDGDPEWQERIERHRARRPALWGCAETSEVATILMDPDLAHRWDAVLIDSVTTLISAWVDEAGAWEDSETARQLVTSRVEELVNALRICPVPVTMVSDEVGLGGVASHPTARLFADALGRANVALAAACDDVVVVVAGLPLALLSRTSPPPRVEPPSATMTATSHPWRDAWRLSVGTFTRWPVKPPCQITPVVAARAMVLSPVATLPLGVGVLLALFAGALTSWTPLVLATLIYAGLVWATRLMHVDGLADTVDGWCVPHDPPRALHAMKASDVGPGGVVAILVSGLVQVGCLAVVLSALAAGSPMSLPVLLGVAWCLPGSRWATTWACRPGVPAARPTGLGAMVAGTVSGAAVGVSGVLLLALGTTSMVVTGGPLWLIPAVVVVQWAVAAWVVRAAVARFGGVTGDVLGAVIELALTGGLLVVAACLPLL